MHISKDGGVVSVNSEKASKPLVVLFCVGGYLYRGYKRKRRRYHLY